MCQCLHIIIQPIKSERKSESKTKNQTVSGKQAVRGKGGRGDGSCVLRAQVLRRVGK